MKIVFFGSTSDSVLVLKKLSDVVAVVTQPPKPIGRKRILAPTPVELWAKRHGIPVHYTAPDVPCDLIVSASYGEKIPMKRIASATLGGLNVHPSLLPRWRGGDPVPWAILSGDRQIGVTVVTLTEKFDAGEIIAQKKIPVAGDDFSGPLRTRLFAIGADLLTEILKTYRGVKPSHIESDTASHLVEPYARRLTRDDGFEPWENIINPKDAERINRKFRAFHPWPGLWTRFQKKRLKILSFTDKPVTVQLEGKTPVSWQQFSEAYLAS